MCLRINFQHNRAFLPRPVVSFLQFMAYYLHISFRRHTFVGIVSLTFLFNASYFFEHCTHFYDFTRAAAAVIAGWYDFLGWELGDYTCRGLFLITFSITPANALQNGLWRLFVKFCIDKELVQYHEYYLNDASGQRVLAMPHDPFYEAGKSIRIYPWLRNIKD